MLVLFIIAPCHPIDHYRGGSRQCVVGSVTRGTRSTQELRPRGCESWETRHGGHDYRSLQEPTPTVTCW